MISPPDDDNVVHVHGEAFRHMTYASRDGSARLRIWNSRDGVTPFGCSHPVTGVELFHAGPWSLDRYDPAYVPDVGEWVWVDLHPERAMELAVANVERWWDDPTYPLSGRMEKADAVKMFFQEFMFFTDPTTGERTDKRGPDLVQVTGPLRDEFVARLQAGAR